MTQSTDLHLTERAAPPIREASHEIIAILAAAREGCHDQETIRAALATFAAVSTGQPFSMLIPKNGY